MNVRAGNERYARLLFASITVVLTAMQPRAQSGPLLPAVDLRRDLRLSNQVWPGNFNGDGVTDLVASRTPSPGVPGVIHVVIGRGDGTFGAPIATSFSGRAIQVADFNGDRRVDVVAAPTPPAEGAFLLPGNGNGTFGTPRRVDTSFTASAITGNFNGDTRRDLVLTGGPEVRVFPGNGDLTFGTPARFALGDGGVSADCLEFVLDAQSCGGGIAGDFDNDGDSDFAVTNAGTAVQVFVNAGGLVFSSSSVAVAFETTDVVARDLNADGDLDLIVTTTDHDIFTRTPGAVYVLRGGSGATFQPPVRYEVPPGAFQVVVGDFTHDGRFDIATANRSFLHWPNCGPFRQSSDSVSILAGTAAGFGPPTTFALSDQSIIVSDDDENARFRGTVFSLNTSDLDRDGFPDLIASQGAILLTRAPAPNRPPVADAGPDVTLVSDPFVRLEGRATDPDNHLLQFAWTGPEGAPGPSTFCFEGGLGDGAHTFTLTVDDRQGGIDEDTVVITRRSIVEPVVRVVRPTPGEVVPAGTPYTIRWEASDDIGITHFYVLAVLGNNRTFNIPECLVPGTATGCTWRNPMPSEDAMLIVVATDTDGARGQDSTGQFFIRGSVAPNSLPEVWTNEDVGAVGAAGNASFSGGRFTIRGSGADIWNTADEFHWVYRLTGGNFEISARVDSVQNVNRWVKAGLMVRESSAPGARHVSLFATPTTEKGTAFQRRTTTGGPSVHTSGPALAPPVWLRLARFGDVIRAYSRKSIVDPWTLVGEQVLPNLPHPVQIGLAVSSHVDGRLAEATFSNVSAGGLHDWRSATVGDSQGSAAFDGTRFTIEGSGADIWNNSDAFTMAWTTFAAPENMFTARVLSVENTHRWAKAGVMIRENGLPESRHVMVVVSAGRGVAMQWRPATGGPSMSTALRPGVAPAWVRLVQRSGTFTGYTSSDGVTWIEVGRVTLPMSSFLHALMVTSHNTSAVATAVFDDVKLGVP
jgi:regulation of enolase protein 1 (concanavalin A-like superfamily)